MPTPSTPGMEPGAFDFWLIEHGPFNPNYARWQTEKTRGEGAQYVGGYASNESVLPMVKKLLDHMDSVAPSYPAGPAGRKAFLELRDNGCDRIAQECRVSLDAVREAYSNEVHRRNREKNSG